MVNKRTPTHEERQAYDAYMHSSAWYKRREAELRRAGNRCEECDIHVHQAGVLQVHHVTYERLGNEADGDLRVLCRGCHYDVHYPRVEYDDEDEWWEVA